uniref:N-formylglutamate amidohydrolase n=1 Tax=Macrostomum lignano TaxID=282301 RepID=A0A1I8IY09_9PLAT
MRLTILRVVTKEKLKMFCPIVLLLIVALSTASDRWDPDGQVQYSPGSACIVLSAPHGGRQRPDWISDRRAVGCETADGDCRWNATCPGSSCRALLYGDPNTREIATAVRDYLTEDGLRPHLIANHMDRMKMDPNRGGPTLSEGIQCDPAAKRVYDSYHGFVRQAVDAVRRSCRGRGLLLDIHGQHHPQNWTEIGYLCQHQHPRPGRPAPPAIPASSLSARKFIIGDRSFGSLLNSFGYRVVPSASVPAPETGGYYSGGFITRQYGSLTGGEFDSMQVEITQAVMYASEAERDRFSRHLAATIGLFARANGYA